MFVVLGLLLAGPLLVAILAPFLFAARAGGAAGGILGAWLLPVLLVAATGGAGVAWHRSTRHRAAWLVAFVVLLALDLGVAAVVEQYLEPTAAQRPRTRSAPTRSIGEPRTATASEEP